MRLNNDLTLVFSVFVIPVFEVDDDQQIPSTKAELSRMMDSHVAQWFHLNFCKHCHQIPHNDKWFLDDKDDEMRIFTSVKRRGEQSFWEPFYIGTNSEPIWDERLDWEGKANKMAQAYVMCLIDYNYNVLTNAFLVHKPGIKTLDWKKANVDPTHRKSKSKLLRTDIKQESDVLYKYREGCNVLKTIFRGEPIVPGDFPTHLIAYKHKEGGKKHKKTKLTEKL